MTLYYVVPMIVGYLCGSLSFSIIITKLLGRGDIRNHGSGNAGATNTARSLGLVWGIVVVLLDMVKAIIPVGISVYRIAPDYGLSAPLLGVLVTFSVLLGHLLPIFHGFRGGKGVAVLAGAIGTQFPLLALIAFLLMVPIIIITRMVSLAVFIVAFLLPIGYIVLYPDRDGVYIAFFILIGAILFWTHRKNFGRIIRGEENKLTFRRK